LSSFWPSTGKRASSPETEKETRFGEKKEFQERKIFQNSQQEFQERITIMTFQKTLCSFFDSFSAKKMSRESLPTVAT